MVALFVILFVAVLLTIDFIIQLRHKKYPLISPVKSFSVSNSDFVRMPKGIFFHPAHTWARIGGGSDLVVGVDDFIQKAMGGIDAVNLPTVGQKVKQGDPVITLERGGRTLTLVAPVSGVVRSINMDALQNPALVSENPYSDGWLLQITPSELASGLSALRIAENAVTWIREEAARFRDFVAARTMTPAYAGGETMLDGGVPVAGSLEHLDPAALEEFEQSFLR